MSVDIARSADGSIAVTTVQVADAAAARALIQSSSRAADFVSADVSTQYRLFGAPDPRIGEAVHLREIGAPQAWATSQGAGVVVAVLDDRVDTTHPELRGRTLPVVNLAGAAYDVAVPQEHGTAVASTVAAALGNGEGAAGVAPAATIMPVTVCVDRGCSSSSVANGIVHAADHGARVINLSLGSPVESAVMKAAVDYALRKGVVVVAAAGNDGDECAPGCDESPNYPAAFPGVVSVAAGGPAGASPWSNHDGQVALSAPGEDIFVARSGGGYHRLSGTSFAAPQVAGAAADVLAVAPGMTPEQVRTLLVSTAQEVQGWPAGYGSGLLDVQSAVASAKGDVKRADGSVSYTRAGVARVVRGDILRRYDLLDAERGDLGWPVTDEVALPGGARSQFERGDIVWSPATGAKVLKGAIRGHWLTSGGVASPLGYPTGEEFLVAGGRGHVQAFVGGLVYWTPQTGPQTVRGEILRRYSSLGWENGPLGFPTTSEVRLRFGAFSAFEGGAIYWSPATGAHAVRGALRVAWASTGWENGYLGYPTSDEYRVAGGVRQDFQGRTLQFTFATGKVTEVR
ncbi:S8 family serine peptidase [Kineococcus sp. SYSU DK004]|uniref:S8 family serine peptidase n=1 Tax=Kineococcus sp. SYSU DK004 TaxID=3383125 RepID=UPI003D7EF355